MAERNTAQGIEVAAPGGRLPLVLVISVSLPATHGTNERMRADGDAIADMLFDAVPSGTLRRLSDELVERLSNLDANLEDVLPIRE